MGGLHDVAGEANFEAKESGESHNVGSRWGVVVRGRPIRGSRWSVGDTPTENTAPVITLGDEEISDVSLATFYVFDNENAGTHRPAYNLPKNAATEAAEAARLTEAVEAVVAAEARQAAEGRMVCSR
jgi:hypothetical protein